MPDYHEPRGNKLPISEDSAIELTNSTKPEIESVKPIYRPREKFSEPIKPHWVWVWIIVVVLVVLAWVVLFSYFSSHHAPHSAPL